MSLLLLVAVWQSYNRSRSVESVFISNTILGKSFQPRGYLDTCESIAAISSLVSITMHFSIQHALGCNQYIFQSGKPIFLFGHLMNRI